MTRRTRKPRHASTWKQNIRRARVLEQSDLIRANCDLVGLFVSGSNHFFLLFRQAILRDLEQLRAEKEQVLLTDAQQSNARIENCQDYGLALNCQSRLSLKNCSLEKASTGQFQDVPSWLLLLHWSKAWTILNLRQWCFRIVQNLQDSIQTEHSTLQAQWLCKCYWKQYCNLLCFHVSCPSISPVPCPADGTPKTPSWAKQASWHLTF